MPDVEQKGLSWFIIARLTSRAVSTETARELRVYMMCNYDGVLHREAISSSHRLGERRKVSSRRLSKIRFRIVHLTRL